MKKIMYVLSLVLIFSLVGCSTDNSKTIYISAIPDQNQTDLNNAMNELAKQLSEKTGLNIEYKEVLDYSAVVTGFSRKDIALAWFGGLTGVQARESVKGAKAIAQRPKDEQFQSVFIANTNSNINNLNDYRNKTFTFGSESSTSGHLMPRFFINEAGLNPEKDFSGEIGYSGSHDRTIELVENGTYDGGALNISVWEKYLAEGLVDLTKVKLVQDSDYYYDYNFTILPKTEFEDLYGKKSYEKITKALLEIDIESNDDLFKFFNDTKFIATENSNYNGIREVALQLGMIEENDGN